MSTMKSVMSTMGADLKRVARESAAAAADLDWEVKQDRVAGLDTGITFPRKKMLYRSKDNLPLGIVGEDYVPSDPREFLDTQYEFAEFMGGEVVAAGFLPQRSRAFAIIHAGELTVNIKKGVGDPVGVYIFSSDGWDGGTATSSRLYMERLVCANGMTSRELSGDFWVSHTAGRADLYEVRWKKFLAEVRHTTGVIQSQFERLAKTKMSQDEMLVFVRELLPGESTRTENRQRQILQLFSHGEGNHGQTRWDAYNAVTEYATHHSTVRGENAQVNRFLTVMEGPPLAQRAWKMLTAA